MRYKKQFDEKKLAAIDEELRALEQGNDIDYENGAPLVPRPRGRKKWIVADEYCISHMTVTRLIRIDTLCDELKDLVDSGNIRIRSAVYLSYISIDTQKRLYDCMSAMGVNTIDMVTAKDLRHMYAKGNELTTEEIEQALNRTESVLIVEKPHKITVSTEVYDRYLKNVLKRDVDSIIEKALELYFKGA